MGEEEKKQGGRDAFFLRASSFFRSWGSEGREEMCGGSREERGRHHGGKVLRYLGTGLYETTRHENKGAVSGIIKGEE